MNYDRTLSGVVIDAGHGGVDSGAVGNGMKEKDLTLSISKYMYDRFNELGIPVALTRNNDTTLTSDERPKVALSKFGNGKDVIIISNHINAGGGEGAEVIYALRNTDTLAKTILNNIGKKGQKTRKYYQRKLPTDMSKDYYFMLRNTPDAETVIVEYGFIDNVNDANKLIKNYKDYADAVIDAVLEYKGIKFDNDYYIVKKGDTLWSVAKLNNITVDELKDINNLTTNMLTIGQKLKLNKNEKIIDDNILVGDTYKVLPGDTLYSISKKFNISVEKLKRINNLTSNVLSIGQILLVSEDLIEPDILETDTYTVKSGDTLYKIANIYNITVDELKTINNLKNDTLSINQKLLVPKTNNTYVVKKGDTLYSIAKSNNLTLNKLKELNSLDDNIISVGQILLVK